ncbi:hypothetical protein B0H14DRAFT_3732815 [Mycena olivaceomarginata]|nr:hypothetical protein B0H14DRAFT_3732815 [Mycena olivaceomarginata]
MAKETVSGNEQCGSVSTVSGRTSYPSTTAKRWPTAMILLAPRHLQEVYTSTNTTKGLRSHGLLDEGPDRDREREGANNRDTGSTGQIEKGRQNGGKDKENGRKEKEKAGSSEQQMSSTSSPTNTHHNEIIAPPPPPPSVPSMHNHPLPTGAPFDDRDPNFTGPTLAVWSASSSQKRRRDSLDESDLDSGSERLSSRTTHTEAFSTMDASSINQMMLSQDPAGTRHERRKRHDVLTNSFEDVGLLPPKKSAGGTRAKKAPVGGVDIFAQVPSDALFMLLPLWPGSTDPASERNAPKQPHEIPTEQRQYLLVSYKPTNKRPPPHSKHDKEDGQSKKESSQNSLTSGADEGTDKGCNILLTSYHICASLASHADLQGSGVRLPDEGLPVVGSWHEAWLTKPQIATRDYGLLVIGMCASRDAGIEFDPEGLVNLGLCIPVPLDTASDEPGLRELTPIGKAVLEMACIGGIAVTSFGPAGSS